jgi:tetratricopeptide (TPR) repeat protein
LAYSYRADANNSRQDYEKALNDVKKAINIAEELHRKDPKKHDPVSKDWYQSWFVISYKMKDYQQAFDVTKLLVAKWPTDKDFWSYYGNVALLLHKDQTATAVYGLMYKKGLLKSKDDYLQLASLLLEQGAPYKAAEVLTDGMNKGYIPKTKDSYDQISSAWTAARDWDKALATLGEEAKVSSNGKVYLRQAEIYLERRDYNKARQAVQSALNKGSLGDEAGRALMVLGQSEYELKNYENAVNAFKRAEKYKQQEQNARQWLKYVAQARSGG